MDEVHKFPYFLVPQLKDTNPSFTSQVISLLAEKERARSPYIILIAGDNHNIHTLKYPNALQYFSLRFIHTDKAGHAGQRRVSGGISIRIRQEP